MTGHTLERKPGLGGCLAVRRARQVLVVPSDVQPWIGGKEWLRRWDALEHAAPRLVRVERQFRATGLVQQSTGKEVAKRLHVVLN